MMSKQQREGVEEEELVEAFKSVKRLSVNYTNCVIESLTKTMKGS